MKLLVLGAWEPELTHFRALAAARTHPFAEIVVEVAGVGLVEAAIGTARAIARHGPTHALLLGTCGALAADLRVGDVVVGDTVALVDPQGELPEVMPSRGVFDPGLKKALSSAGRSVVVASTLAITTDDATAARLRAKADVEHLEAFAFLRACADRDVPCAAVLAVANAVGSEGRREWLDNHEAASARAGEAAFRALESLGGERESTRRGEEEKDEGG